jgi:hypothetical protein
VHFVDKYENVLDPKLPLVALDTPMSGEQVWARQQLISVYALRYAGKSVLQSIEARGGQATTLATYLALAGVCTALFLAMVILVTMWCAQNHRYQRKLKAATTFAFGAPDYARNGTIFDLPGTNLHARYKENSDFKKIFLLQFKPTLVVGIR